MAEVLLPAPVFTRDDSWKHDAEPDNVAPMNGDDSEEGRRAAEERAAPDTGGEDPHAAVDDDSDDDWDDDSDDESDDGSDSDPDDDWEAALYQSFLRAVISDTERDIRHSKSDRERAAHERFLQDMRERLELSLALDGDANEE